MESLLAERVFHRQTAQIGHVAGFGHFLSEKFAIRVENPADAALEFRELLK